MAQYQDTIPRLLLEDADEALTRAAFDVIMPEAPAVHFIRGEELLYAVAKRGKLEKVEHLLDQQRASMLDELTVDRESRLAVSRSVRWLLKRVLSWGSGTESLTSLGLPRGAWQWFLPLDGLMAGP